MNTFFETNISDNPGETAGRLAGDFASWLRDKASGSDDVFIALSGGSTPLMLFRLLTGMQKELPRWDNIHFFWVDERCVPQSSEESNYGNAFRLLLDKIDIPAGNIHPVNGEEDPSAEAARYAGEIKKYLPSGNGYPVFDLILLGMGDDGHTASIFPRHEVLPDASSLCAVSVHPSSGQKRITLTEHVINNAREVVFMVTGGSKARVLKEIFENNEGADLLPAKRIAPVNGRLSWYLDKAAAALLLNPQD